MDDPLHKLDPSAIIHPIIVDGSMKSPLAPHGTHWQRHGSRRLALGRGWGNLSGLTVLHDACCCWVLTLYTAILMAVSVPRGTAHLCVSVSPKPGQCLPVDTSSRRAFPCGWSALGESPRPSLELAIWHRSSHGGEAPTSWWSDIWGHTCTSLESGNTGQLAFFSWEGAHEGLTATFRR